MSSHNEIRAEMNAAQLKLTGVLMRTEAVQKLVDSAAFLGQGEELDNLHLHLHALLDEKLDLCVRIMQLTRAMMEL